MRGRDGKRKKPRQEYRRPPPQQRTVMHARHTLLARTSPSTSIIVLRGNTNTILGLSAADGDWVGTVECVNSRAGHLLNHSCLSARKIASVFRVNRGDAQATDRATRVVLVRGRFNRFEKKTKILNVPPREIGFRPERCRRDRTVPSWCVHHCRLKFVPLAHVVGAYSTSARSQFTERINKQRGYNILSNTILSTVVCSTPYNYPVLSSGSSPVVRSHLPFSERKYTGVN